MPYFKNSDGVYFSDSYEPTLGGRLATEQEIQEFNDHQQREKIKEQIAAIEKADLMNRRAREAFLLQAEQIAADQYGLTPEQLYAVNPGYRGAKDVDNEVKALRALL